MATSGIESIIVECYPPLCEMVVLNSKSEGGESSGVLFPLWIGLALYAVQQVVRYVLYSQARDDDYMRTLTEYLVELDGWAEIANQLGSAEHIKKLKDVLLQDNGRLFAVVHLNMKTIEAMQSIGDRFTVAELRVIQSLNRAVFLLLNKYDSLNSEYFGDMGVDRKERIIESMEGASLKFCSACLEFEDLPAVRKFRKENNLHPRYSFCSEVQDKSEDNA